MKLDEPSLTKTCAVYVYVYKCERVSCVFQCVCEWMKVDVSFCINIQVLAMNMP